MNDKELRDAAVAELKLTTAGWLKTNGVPRYPSGTAPATTHWGKAMTLLEQIGAVVPPPPGNIVPAPANLATLHANAQPGAVIRLGPGNHGNQALALNKPVTFMGEPGSVLGDVGIDGSGIELASRDPLLMMKVGRVMVGSGAQAEDIVLRNLDGILFGINYAVRTRIYGGDWGPAVEEKPHIATSGSQNAIPTDTLIDGAFIHDMTMPPTGTHVEGLLVMVGNGLVVRNCTFNGNGGTGDMMIAGYPPGFVLSNIILDNNRFLSAPWQKDGDASFNIQYQGGIVGLDIRANNTFSKGNLNLGGSPPSLPPPPNWPPAQMSYSSEVLADSPNAYYHMDEASGQPQDSAGTNHTTVTGGSPTYSVSGAVGTAITLNGTSGYFSAPDHATLDLGDVFTLEAWVKVPTVIGGQGIRRSIVDKGTNGYWFGLLADGTILVGKQDVEDGPSGGLIPNTTSWHHLVTTQNAGTPLIYLNGVDVTVAGGAPTYENTAIVLKLGSSINSQFWEGSLDEIALYPTALSAARVLAHYNAAASAAGPGDNPPIGILGRGAGWQRVAAFTSAGSAWTTTAGNKTVTATPVLADLIVVIAGTSGLAGGTTNVTDNNTDGFGTTPGYTQIDVDRTGFSTTGVLTMWIRNKLIGSATSTIFTMAQGSSSGGGGEVCRISGMSIVGLGAVRGSGGQSSGGAGATPAPVLLRRVGTTFSGTQAALTANLCIGVVMGGTVAPAVTQPASWSESLDLNYTVPTTGMETCFRNSGEVGSTITWGSTIATAFASMAIELDISVPVYDWVVQGLGQNESVSTAVSKAANWQMFGDGASLLSDFTGVDENPLSEGGKWAQLNTISDPLIRVSNAAGQAASTTGESYWTVQNYGPDLDVYVTITTMPLAGNNIDVSARTQGAGGANTYDGYRARMIQNAGTDSLTICRVANAAITTLATMTTRDFAVGEKVGIRCLGSTVEAWYYAGVWTLGLSIVDTTYPAAGKIALHVRGTTGRADDFSAGPIVMAGGTLPHIGGRGAA